ncbi:MAG: hypothetical protein LBC64_07530 [Fibromonadaceae bacterium]|jgi:hypothetical protein|nr:hypothetical protein [Fibromonadaceae bacterium]
MEKTEWSKEKIEEEINKMKMVEDSILETFEVPNFIIDYAKEQADFFSKLNNMKIDYKFFLFIFINIGMSAYREEFKKRNFAS